VSHSISRELRSEQGGYYGADRSANESARLVPMLFKGIILYRDAFREWLRQK
jgi:hypothetical protein